MVSTLKVASPPSTGFCGTGWTVMIGIVATVRRHRTDREAKIIPNFHCVFPSVSYLNVAQHERVVRGAFYKMVVGPPLVAQRRGAAGGNIERHVRTGYHSLRLRLRRNGDRGQPSDIRLHIFDCRVVVVVPSDSGDVKHSS